MKTISLNESNAISLIRVLSLISIISCHCFQAFNNKWAFVLNIGVQIFLFMSGYLYGHKDIDNFSIFFLGRIKRVYVPYIIFVITMLLIYECFTSIHVSWKDFLFHILDLQAFRGGVGDGRVVLGHLWFITAIGLSYLTTPILQKFKNNSSLIFILLLLIGVIEYLFLHKMLYLFSWIYLYAMGYFYANLKKQFKIVFIILSTVLSIVIILHTSWIDILASNINNRIFHDIIGISIFVDFVFIVKMFSISKCMSMVKILDKYSYQAFLTHHVFLFGPFSILLLSKSMQINIFLFLIFTILSSYILYVISNALLEIFQRNHLLKSLFIKYLS